MRNGKLIRHYSGRVKQIDTEVGLRSRFDSDESNYHSYKAIWDTGAMSSAVSPKVVEEMRLPQISTTFVRGIGDEEDIEKPVYLVDIKLSNGTIVKGAKVVGIEIGGVDAALGMDVISRGNFSIYYDEQGDMNMSFELLYEL